MSPLLQADESRHFDRLLSALVYVLRGQLAEASELIRIELEEIPFQTGAPRMHRFLRLRQVLANVANSLSRNDVATAVQLLQQAAEAAFPDRRFLSPCPTLLEQKLS